MVAGGQWQQPMDGYFQQWMASASARLPCSSVGLVLCLVPCGVLDLATHSAFSLPPHQTSAFRCTLVLEHQPLMQMEWLNVSRMLSKSHMQPAAQLALWWHCDSCAFRMTPNAISWVAHFLTTLLPPSLTSCCPSLIFPLYTLSSSQLFQLSHPPLIFLISAHT